jgi:hypothetical protein
MSRTYMHRWVLVAGLSASAVLATSAVASAAATITRFTFSTTETFTDSPPECMPVLKTGVTNATETGAGQITQTPNGSAVHFSSLFEYRTDFPDGSYLTGSAVDHGSFVTTPTRAVSTEVIQEPRTIHAADGTPTAIVMIHFIAHTTVNAATGEASASIERFFFTCS